MQRLILCRYKLTAFYKSEIVCPQKSKVTGMFDMSFNRVFFLYKNYLEVLWNLEIKTRWKPWKPFSKPIIGILPGFHFPDFIEF